MSTVSVVGTITQNELLYGPAVIAGVQMAEAVAPDAPGAEKAQAVLNGVLAASAAIATNTSTPPTVGGIAALINLSVSIINAFGLFGKKKVTSAPPSAGASVAGVA